MTDIQKCKYRNNNISNDLAPFQSYGKFYELLTPPLFHPNFGVFLLHQIAHVGRQRAHGP